MELTVGKLEEMLRNYNPGEKVVVGCNCCNSGSMGKDVISIEDYTNQTFGYIRVSLNSVSKPNVELNEDKLEFYKRELEKSRLEVNKLERKLKIYEDALDSINTSLNVNDKRLKWEIKNEHI